MDLAAVAVYGGSVGDVELGAVKFVTVGAARNADKCANVGTRVAMLQYKTAGTPWKTFASAKVPYGLKEGATFEVYATLGQESPAAPSLQTRRVISAGVAKPVQRRLRPGAQGAPGPQVVFAVLQCPRTS